MISKYRSIDLTQAGCVDGPFSLMASVGILLLIDVILGDVLEVGGFRVVAREISGFSGSDSLAGLGFRIGALDAVCDLVTARDLPRLGVRGGGFAVLVKSPSNRLLLDPPLIYRLIRVGGLIAICLRLVTKKSIWTGSRRQ